jgi:hypothetical protein
MIGILAGLNVLRDHAVTNPVFGVLRRSSVFEVFEPVVERVIVQVPDYLPFRAWPNERRQHKTVNREHLVNTVVGKENDGPTSTKTSFENLPFVSSPFAIQAGFAANSALVGNGVHSLITRHW